MQSRLKVVCHRLSIPLNTANRAPVCLPRTHLQQALVRWRGAQELGMYGRLRKVARCGPVLMFRRLLVMWRDTHTPAVIAEKVQTFFR